MYHRLRAEVSSNQTMLSNLKIFLMLCFLQSAFTEEQDHYWDRWDMSSSFIYCWKLNLNVAVYYESLDPDSIEFFNKQFSRNWRPFLEYINIVLVPYGKANHSTDAEGNQAFNCTRGEDECYGNRIQACAISMLHQTRANNLFGFITCYMSHTDQKNEGPKCATRYHVDYQKLKDCANSEEGFNLMKSLGDRTHRITPESSRMPAIVFNNEGYNKADSEDANKNLMSVLCRKLEKKPKICH